MCTNLLILEPSKMISLHCYSHFPILRDSSSSSSPSPSPRIKPQFCPNLVPRFSSVFKRFHKTRNQTILRRNDFSDGVDPVHESTHIDENGAVQDMNGYLDYLSLEYDSVWDTKPSWCQPWTILLTGIGIITGSWLIVNSIVFTSMVATLICLWWYIFLYSFPKEYSDMIVERRKKVANGIEDTYGIEN
ncbi:hypothetical protein OROMI_029464 [Orobanche minor]